MGLFRGYSPRTIGARLSVSAATIHQFCVWLPRPSAHSSFVTQISFHPAPRHVRRFCVQQQLHRPHTQLHSLISTTSFFHLVHRLRWGWRGFVPIVGRGNEAGAKERFAEAFSPPCEYVKTVRIVDSVVASTKSS